MRVAIIPARGGSKRIHRKNIKSFLGKPIIGYSIEQAIKSELFDVVMVSTDDVEIAKIAKDYGAEVPFMRSGKNSDDNATTVEVLLEVVEKYKGQGILVQEACCIYPTAPFVSIDMLKKGLDLLLSGKFDVTFPVLQYSYPIQRALKINEGEKMEMFSPKEKETRSQDLEKSYHDSGQFYWFVSEIIELKKELWTDNTGVFVLSDLEAHDIDTIEDWEIAEFKYRLLKNGKG